MASNNKKNTTRMIRRMQEVELQNVKKVNIVYQGYKAHTKQYPKALCN